jgi:hypothetical protein
MLEMMESTTTTTKPTTSSSTTSLGVIFHALLSKLVIQFTLFGIREGLVCSCNISEFVFCIGVVFISVWMVASV